MIQAPLPPTPKAIDKCIQTDYFEGWQYLSYTAAHGSAIVTETQPFDAGMLALPRIPVNKGKSILLKVWSNHATGAVSLQFLMNSHRGPQMINVGNNQKLTASMPSNTIVGAFTTSGMKCVNANPFTGEADASNSYWATSAFTANTAAHCDNRVTQYPSSSVASGDIYFGMDGLGDGELVPWCYTLTNATIYLIGWKRVE